MAFISPSKLNPVIEEQPLKQSSSINDTLYVFSFTVTVAGTVNVPSLL